ncbi:hypothetical protein IAG44_23815 [Streptomyces roseirectus]|uniref:Uncharacterized protein n=1 Tax=Streptomyces roseirectus TaxID=2768066 RepID=A0A7H0IH74_9ACTN|nr:hypothetical protein IAG44_23815 [Streptomyces roseirectus]
MLGLLVFSEGVRVRVWVFLVMVVGELSVPVAAEAIGKAHVSATAVVTVPAALCLVTVRALHARHFKVGSGQQAVLPGTAVLVLRRTFLGHGAVLAAGVVGACAVAVGTALSARAGVRVRAGA